MNKEKLLTKIDQVISQLTLEEKIKMIHGAGLFETGAVERMNIPPLKMSDGPMGVGTNLKRTPGFRQDMMTIM